MNLIRTASSTPKRLFLLPPCTIASYTSKVADSVFNSWRDLVKNPMDWCDYREDKLIGLKKAKYPDFKHKTNETALWLNTAPDSVLAGLEGLNVGKSKKDDSWKDLVQNPDKWWDYRSRKTSVNAPEFAHKETREGLWLDSSPKWVLPMLERLKAGKGKKEGSWKHLVENPDKWLDNRPTKTNLKVPDFVHKDSGEGLWLDSSPKWVLTVLEGLNVEMGKKEDSWMNLVENPDQWWDKRSIKSNVSTPDFIHKETNEGLWLDSSPKWVLAMLEGLNVGKTEDSWKNLLENPDKWWDKRLRKIKVNAPDFKHKESSEALWLDSAPKWVLPGLEGLNVGKRMKEDHWKNFVENPDKWWDNRKSKIKVNSPDFRHKETHEGLWLNSAPKWVLAGPDGLNVGKENKEDSWKNLVENPDKWLDNRPSKIKLNAPDFIHKETSEGLFLASSPKWVLSQLPC